MRSHGGWGAALPGLLGVVVLICFAARAAETPIDDKYAETGGGSGRLGMPTAPEAATPDGVGRFRQFARGVIYWHPNTGAHMVIGLILARWSELGAEKGYLGYPMTDEIGTFDGSGRVALDSPRNPIVSDEDEKVRLYLKNLEMLWRLGIVPKQRQESAASALRIALPSDLLTNTLPSARLVRRV
jgi:hypothetical protein